MPKLVRLIKILAVALGFAVFFLLGIFLSSSLAMTGNFGGMGMMRGPWMFAPMLLPSLMVAVIVAGIGIVAYNLLLPKINLTSVSEIAPVDYRDAVLRLLKDDERQVVEALANSGGVAYQRDLQHATGLSKVKTHRVIARLAERRLVNVTRAGKTNQIRIPSWLVGDTSS